MAEFLLLSVPALPLLLAAALAIPVLRSAIALALPLAPLPAVAAALALPVPIGYAEPWLLLGSRLGLDAWSRGFLFFTGLIWLLAGIAATLHLARDPLRTGFFACFLLAMAGNLGLILAEDVFTFYAFFALMSFASYGLVVHGRGPESVFAARVYIVFVVAGELALFAGLALAASGAGSTLLADLAAAPQPGLATALLVAGFGVKFGLVPLHLWLPLAHAAAPFPASAVLSGAMIKAGLFGLVAVLPLGTGAMPVLGAALGAAGLVSIVLAGLVGVTQTNPKAVLAYSSVGQMGLIALALGAGLAAPEIWPVLAPALVFYAAHHGFSKAALFLGVGACGAAAHRWRRAMLAILLVPAAGLAALPLTTGYAAKSALERGFGLAAEGWVPHLAAAVAVGSVATALLMMRFFIVLARKEGRAGSPALALPWLGAVGLAAAAGLLWPFGAPPRATLSAEGVVTGLLPLGVAAALAATAALLLGLLRLKVREVPPGETLALFERVTAPRRRPATIAALLPRWPALPAIRLRQPAGWGAGALATAAVLLAMALTEAPRAIAFPG